VTPTDPAGAPAGAEVAFLAPAQAATREGFLRWQCRVRQFAARRAAGQPAPGMRPTVLTLERTELADGIITVLVERDPERSIDLFRQIYRRTHDPAERRAAMLETLAGAYFQQPMRFSDTLTSLFLSGSALAARFTAAADCLLVFDDGITRFSLTCRVDDLGRKHPFYQATWYHNALFNPNLPGDARVLAFIPDWTRSGPQPR